MRRQDGATILDVLHAARKALDFLGDLDLAGLLADEKTQSAVLHQLLVVGEAVKRLSPEFREGRPDVPWKKIAGMRDFLVHAYDDVDVGSVYETLKTDVPDLLERLRDAAPDREST